MRTILTAALLAAMAASAPAKEPTRNRMNEPFPESRQREAITPSAQSGLPLPTANRMNALYGESSVEEMTGGPNPFRNRMNLEWPKAKAQPQETERKPIKPAPRVE